MGLLYSGKTKKYDYDKFFIQYRSDKTEEIIAVDREEGKTVVEIILAPAGDVSKKETVKMYGNMGVTRNNKRDSGDRHC